MLGRNARRVVALAVVLAVGLASYAAYVAVTTPTTPTLVVYTYDSLLGGGCGDQANRSANSTFETVFGAFERAHHVTVTLVCPGGTLVGTLASEANAPAADVVIGLDEVTGPQAVADGLIAPYTPPTPGDDVPGIAAVLGAPGYLTPYEYGYLALDVNTSFNDAGAGAPMGWSFPTLASNASLASNLLIEDPTTDITGEEFLLWEAAFYAQVLHQPWQPFWQATLPHLHVADDWTDAYNEFLGGPGSPPMLVSYSLDPAYEAYYGTSGFNASVGLWNGTAYGWETVYGLGVVRGCAHPALAQDLVRWFQTSDVESQLPDTEWEYAANASVPPPTDAGAAPAPASIVPLDADGAGPMVANLSAYLDGWQTLADGAG